MTIARLNQYRYLVHEMEQLEAALERMESRTLRDSVLSSDGPGRTLIEISVYGTQGKRRLKADYRFRIKRLCKERAAVESYIASIGSSYIRQIITLRYISGMTWQQVADKVGGSEDSVRKACRRFVEQN